MRTDEEIKEHLKKMIIEADTIVSNRNKVLSQKILINKKGRKIGTIIA